MSDPTAQFAKARYMNLETFRKSGAGVRTPVWFAQLPGKALFYVYSRADAGKIKRIRNNPKVRVAPCNFRGVVAGEWVDAQARICGADEGRQAQQLLRHKYLLKRIGDLFARIRKPNNVTLAIELI